MSNCPNYTSARPVSRNAIIFATLVFSKISLEDTQVLVLFSERFERGEIEDEKKRRKRKRKKRRFVVEAWRGPRYPDRFCKSTEIRGNWVVALEGRRTRHLTANYRLQGERSRFSGVYVHSRRRGRRRAEAKRRLGSEASYQPIPPEHLRTHLAPIKRPANLFNAAALGDLRPAIVDPIKLG